MAPTSSFRFKHKKKAMSATKGNFAQVPYLLWSLHHFLLSVQCSITLTLQGSKYKAPSDDSTATSSITDCIWNPPWCHTWLLKLDFETWGFQFWLPICRDIWNQKDLLHTGPSGSVNACVGVILMFHSVCCISLVSYLHVVVLLHAFILKSCYFLPSSS